MANIYVGEEEGGVAIKFSSADGRYGVVMMYRHELSGMGVAEAIGVLIEKLTCLQRSEEASDADEQRS